MSAIARHRHLPHPHRIRSYRPPRRTWRWVIRSEWRTHWQPGLSQLDSLGVHRAALEASVLLSFAVLLVLLEVRL